MVTSSSPSTVTVAAAPSGVTLLSAYLYPVGVNPGFVPSTGQATNPPPASVALVPGVYSQFTAYAWEAVGSSPVGLPIDFVLDGVVAYSTILGSSGGSANEAVAFFGSSFSAGTHTFQASIDGVLTNTITLNVA